MVNSSDLEHSFWSGNQRAQFVLCGSQNWLLKTAFPLFPTTALSSQNSELVPGLRQWSEYNLGCFYFLAIKNKVAISFCVDVGFQFSWVWIPKGGDAGSYDNSRIDILMNYQIIVPNTYIILHFHQLCMRIPIYPFLSKCSSTFVILLFNLLHPSQCCVWGGILLWLWPTGRVRAMTVSHGFHSFTVLMLW